MRAFDYIRAETLEQALLELGRPDSRALAGGTSLVDLMKLGVEAPARLVDIGSLPLAAITLGQSALSIGALASNSEIASNETVERLFPAVSQAILAGASGQIRNMASLAGNLMQRTRCPYFRSTDWPCNKRQPGSGCTAASGSNAHHAVLGVSASCMAVNPSDLAVALLAFDAEVHLVGPSGRRSVPISQFYLLPAETPEIETVLRPGELITQVVLPRSDLAAASTYLKLRGRASYEFASASIASAILVEGGVVRDVAVALGGLGVVPWRDRTAEAELIGKAIGRQSIERYCDALLAAASPTKDNAYKLDLARGAIHRCLDPDRARDDVTARGSSAE